MKKLVYRLPELPTPDLIIRMVEAGIINQQEAKEILFTTEDK